MKSLTILMATIALATACDESQTAPADTTAGGADATSAAEVQEETSAPDPDACLEILDDCLKRQRTCVVDGGAATCEPCPLGSYPARTDGACTPLEGTRLYHEFEPVTLEPGDEFSGYCQSWILDNDEELWVNAVEMKNTGGYHHSNWFFVPEDHAGWPTGLWKNCYREGFHEYSAALAGGVLYAQSTQVRQEVQKFQAGAAIHIPPRSRVITATHLLNFNIEPITTDLSVAIYTLPEEEVDKPLSPANLVYADLAIPPRASSFFGGSCDLATTYANMFDGAELDIKLHYVLPHYHALAAGFQVAIVGGPRDGERIVDLGAYSTDPYGFVFDPPIDLTGATGLSFGCAFDNPRDEVVGWGIGDQEMCEALLFFEAPLAFVGSIEETTIEKSQDDVQIFEGACEVIGFPFDPRD